VTHACTQETAGLVERLRGALSTCQSQNLAACGLRIHLFVVAAQIHAITVDCTGAAPDVEIGHGGSAHVVLRVKAHSLAPLLAAYSCRELFAHFRDGSIRTVTNSRFSIFVLRERASERTDGALLVTLQGVVDAAIGRDLPDVAN
jgi:hypothetical protein